MLVILAVPASYCEPGFTVDWLLFDLISHLTTWYLCYTWCTMYIQRIITFVCVCLFFCTCTVHVCGHKTFVFAHIIVQRSSWKGCALNTSRYFIIIIVAKDVCYVGYVLQPMLFSNFTCYKRIPEACSIIQCSVDLYNFTVHVPNFTI